MKTRALALGFLVPLCSCQIVLPRGSFAPNLSGFGQGLQEAVVIGHGVWLSALQMCGRTQAELLESAGEAFCFDVQFPCSTSPSTALFCVVGVGGREDVAQWVGEISAAEMLSGCDKVKRMLPELSPSRWGSSHLYIYLCRQAAPLANPIVRLGFQGAIQSAGTISVTCDSVELVGWNDVHFANLPPIRRSD